MVETKGLRRRQHLCVTIEPYAFLEICIQCEKQPEEGANVGRAKESGTERIYARGSAALRIAAMGAVTGALLIALAGCNSKTAATNENFVQALNTYFLTHPDCLFPDAPHFPYEASSPEKTRQMDALESAKLLIQLKDLTIHVSRYSLTPAGARFAPRFCYGYRGHIEIDSFTPPVKAHGFPETQVTYHYSLQDVPVWATVPEVQRAFPAMAKAIRGPSSGTMTLAQTMVNWQVPD